VRVSVFHADQDTGVCSQRGQPAQCVYFLHGAFGQLVLIGELAPKTHASSR
jgi:hypothetical protein